MVTKDTNGARRIASSLIPPRGVEDASTNVGVGGVGLATAIVGAAVGGDDMDVGVVTEAVMVPELTVLMLDTCWTLVATADSIAPELTDDVNVVCTAEKSALSETITVASTLTEPADKTNVTSAFVT